jgi:uncharacterized membrane protein YfcA
LNWIEIIAGFLAGILGAMGFGGGGVLVVFLTLFLDKDQTVAQGINLVFFIPCAIIALIVYSKKKLVEWKIAIPAACFGFGGAIIGVLLSGVIGDEWLPKIFAVLFLVIGLMEVFHKKKDSSD